MAQPVFIPLYADEDLDQITTLRREWEQAKREVTVSMTASPLRVGDEAPAPPDEHPQVVEKEAAYRAFVAEAAERAEMWELHAIGHEEFRGLLKGHPPRTEPDGDGKPQTVVEDDPWGVNAETFGKALLTFVDPEDDDIRTVVSPDLDPAGLRKRIKRLSAGEFDTLWVSAYQLNLGGVADPKAGLSSTGSPRFGVT